MVKLEDLSNIKAIIIPSCDSFDSLKSEDLNRANTAMKFVEENNLPKRCIIAGLGHEKSITLGYEFKSRKNKIGFHRNLYNYLAKNTDWMIGVETNSLNSIENMLYTFPENTEGKYAIVSFPLHLKRFQKIINDAKNAGKISENLKIIGVPTTQHPKWIFYEILSNLKYHTIGKKRYFSKKQQ